MKWKKRGLIYGPNKDQWWSQHYAMMPTPVHLEAENVIRVFFGTTDADRFGRPAFVDLDADDPSVIRTAPTDFLVDLGKIGTFDDSGVIPSCLLNVGGRTYLYYVGFQRAGRVPYMLFPGLLIAEEPGTVRFKRYSEAPIADRSRTNVYSGAAPFVLFDSAQQEYRMWFWRGNEWTNVNGKLYIAAEIHMVTSKDGLTWSQESVPCIVPDPARNEFSVGRPWVTFEGGLYRMYYSVRYTDVLYRLGYAESTDGISWTRLDSEAGIDVSPAGWDSEMICYPAVITVKEKTYLFYNGNNNGETGFGFAELES